MCACDHDCITYYEDSEGNCIITEICLPINISLKHILVGGLQKKTKWIQLIRVSNKVNWRDIGAETFILEQ